MERPAEPLINFFDHHKLIRKLVLEEVSRAIPVLRCLLDLHKLLEKLLVKLLFFVVSDRVLIV